MMPLSFWYRPDILPPLWARILSPIYGAARNVHVCATRGSLSPIPTICVGNITVGGAGKTPVVQALRALLDAYHPVILSRGYGGSLTGPVWVKDTHTSRDVGDEPLLHARGGKVVVARDRLAGAKLAVRGSPHVLIMDDGLQNRQLTAHINFLVIDGALGLGNGALLPAGPLREPLTALLPRLHGVILIGDDIHHVREKLPSSLPVFMAHTVYDTSALDLSQKYVAFCALAWPDKFYMALKNLSVNVIDTHSFSDHHAYTAHEINDLLKNAARENARLITTEKDLVKTPQDIRAQIATLPMQIVFDQPAALSIMIHQHLPLGVA